MGGAGAHFHFGHQFELLVRQAPFPESHLPTPGARSQRKSASRTLPPIMMSGVGILPRKSGSAGSFTAPGHLRNSAQEQATDIFRLSRNPITGLQASFDTPRTLLKDEMGEQ